MPRTFAKTSGPFGSTCPTRAPKPPLARQLPGAFAGGAAVMHSNVSELCQTSGPFGGSCPTQEPKPPLIRQVARRLGQRSGGNGLQCIGHMSTLDLAFSLSPLRGSEGARPRLPRPREKCCNRLLSPVRVGGPRWRPPVASVICQSSGLFG